MERNKTKQVRIGGVALGGGAPVRVQSMTTTPTSDVARTLEQIGRLYAAGCEIVRVAVRDEADARAIRALRGRSPVPIVADIHFSADLAVLSVENGADKIRINPGNIGGEAAVRRVADCVRAHGIPVRVGANTGSIEREHLQKYGRSARALVESALLDVARLEKYGVGDIVISVKASSVPLTVEAYRMLAERTDHPLHLGVTEAGTRESGIVKSSVGIGALLLDGIGDTLRVSLTDDPVEEVIAAKRILRACGLEKDYVEVISCPTCGRCEWDSMGLARRVERAVFGIRKPLKIAVMGCVVNGPGEARDCDVGIAGGKGKCVLFRRGELVGTVRAEEAEAAFLQAVRACLDEDGGAPAVNGAKEANKTSVNGAKEANKTAVNGAKEANKTSVNGAEEAN